MKKKSFILVVFLLLASMFCLTACTGDKGEQGDKGPTGDQGPQGAAGTNGTNGVDGTDGTDGTDGADAVNAVVGIEGNSIVWKNEGAENWTPVISFDDLFAYSRTYTITLDTNGGTIAEDTIKDLIYKEEYTITEAPEKGEYDFIGWFDENDELVENDTVLITKDCTLKAKWLTNVFFDGIDGAKGDTFVEIEDKTTAEIVAALKAKFIDDYCTACGYDATKKAELMAANTSALYTEFLAKAGISGGVLFTVANGSCTTTALYDKYDFLISYMLTRHNVHSSYTAEKPYVRAEYFDARCTYLNQMLHEGDMTSINVSELNGSYTSRQLAQVLANFFNSTSEHLNGTSADKLVPFGSGLIQCDVNGVALLAEDGVTPLAYDPYEGLVEILEVEVKAAVELVEDETYTLPGLTKEGYTFLGWFDGETLVTVVDKAFNGKTIVAKWEAKAN